MRNAAVTAITSGVSDSILPLWRVLNRRKGLFLISGPCVIESETLCLEIARTLKSVCRHRKAGICRMSQTLPAAIACSSVCTSVSTGTPTSVRMRRRMSKPSVIPGPRNDLPEERLALSKLALKT